MDWEKERERQLELARLRLQSLGLEYLKRTIEDFEQNRCNAEQLQLVLEHYAEKARAE